MEKQFNFAVENLHEKINLNLEDYPDDEFAIATMQFLSTRPNSHGLDISEEVLKESAPSILGRWVIADMTGIVDAGTHTNSQHIVGSIPSNQEVQFYYDDDGYYCAAVDVVISKIYAQDYCKIFENDNYRAVSVEMKTTVPEEDESKVLSFRIFAVTTLGKAVNPSCPESNIQFVRFSQDKANEYYQQFHTDSFTALMNFVEERKINMAESTTYKVDKSKESLSDKPWGDVDKTAMRNKIMKASNKASLVKSVYMLVEDGWEDAPSEHLKYPVMELKGDTFVYNKGGLSSALGYAKKEGEDAVVSKIEKIYKKLGLDDSSNGKEETAKMAEKIVEMSAVNIADLWGRVYEEVCCKGNYRYCIEGIYEQDNKKFAVLSDKDGVLYRLDFSLTEEGISFADTMIKVQKEFISSDSIVKFAEPEDAEKFKKFEDDEDSDDDEDKDEDEKNPKSKSDESDDDDDDKDDDDKKPDRTKMSADELMSEVEKLESEIEKRDNIIMENEKELSDLRQFKADIEEKEKAMSVEKTLADVKEFIDEDKAKEFREEGLACKMSELDAWSNKVKAFTFESSKGKSHANTTKTGIWGFSFAGSEVRPASASGHKSIWDD